MTKAKTAPLGEVPLTIGAGTENERTYTFRLSFNRMAQLEEHVSTVVGRDVFYPEIAQKAAKGSIRHIRWLVLAMLQDHHPDITEDQVGDLLMEAGLEQVQQAAMEAASPDAEDSEALKSSGDSAEGAANPSTAQAGTGEGSNSSGVAPV